MSAVFTTATASAASLLLVLLLLNWSLDTLFAPPTLLVPTLLVRVLLLQWSLPVAVAAESLLRPLCADCVCSSLVSERSCMAPCRMTQHGVVNNYKSEMMQAMTLVPIKR